MTLAEEIRGLVVRKVEESRTLDYKLDLPDGRGDSKKDFLQDVTALANTAGGRLVFGVQEEADDAGKPSGVPKELVGCDCDNLDAWKLTAHHWLRDSCDPPLHSANIEAAGEYSRGPAIVVTVPQSWSRPHMVKVDKQRYFYLRHSNGNSPMDWQEIRRAFLFSETIAERMSAFRRERADAISRNENIVPLAHYIRWLCHVLPVQSFAGHFAVDLRGVVNAPQRLCVMGGRPGHATVNFDGVLTTDAEVGGRFVRYTQLYRDGCMELAEAHDNDGLPAAVPHIPGAYWEDRVAEGVSAGLRLLAELGVQPPVFVALTLIHVKDGCFTEQTKPGARDGSPIDRDVLPLPEVEFDELTCNRKRVRLKLTPAIDAAWQSAGWIESQYARDY